MSSEPVAIRVERVGKEFSVYQKPHHRLLEMFSRSGPDRWSRKVRALHDVSFEVARGETMGIIGRNGSGKSTLLQIIAGVMTPSSGEVAVQGRVAALLELGAGFNPDFTGRENVLLNGTVLGLTRNEVEQRFDRIAAFADIGEFLDQPVRAYSSGMFVRLAFAVAINVDPDILVIDEALSVGDEAFQRKCFARIERIRDDGATILFVSHGAGAIIQLCNRTLLLDRGELLATGAPKPVVARYHKLVYGPAEATERVRESIRTDFANGMPEDLSAPVESESAADGHDAEDRAYLDPGLVSVTVIDYPSRGASIEDPHLQALDGRRINVVAAGSELDYVYRARFEVVAAAVRFGMLVKTTSGLELGGTVSAQADAAIPLVDADETLEVRFRFRCALTQGVYFLNSGVLARVDGEEVFLARRVDALMFRVLADPTTCANGIVDFSGSANVNTIARGPE